MASVEPIFDYNECQFSQVSEKYNTARVVVWNTLEVTNSFTLEISMHGKQQILNNRSYKKPKVD